jgi:hypothetical protein
VNQHRKQRRVERRNIWAIRTATRWIELHPERRQYFCETGAAYELWDETELPHCIKRILKARVFWVSEFTEDKQEVNDDSSV